MTSHEFEPSDFDRSIERRARRALFTVSRTEPDTAASIVLSRIGGRSPQTIAEMVVASRLRAGAAAAAIVLMTLCWMDRRSPHEPQVAVDVSILALHDPDSDFDEHRTRPSDLVAEIFDLGTEVPQ